MGRSSRVADAKTPDLRLTLATVSETRQHKTTGAEMMSDIRFKQEYSIS